MSGIRYAVGYENEGRQVGMAFGPYKKLSDALNVVPTGCPVNREAAIYVIDGTSSRPMMIWEKELNEWIPYGRELVKVRIAVSIREDGTWFSFGRTNREGLPYSDDVLITEASNMDGGLRSDIHFINATLPIPEAAQVLEVPGILGQG